MLKISTYKILPSFFLCVVFEHRIINSTYVSLPELFVCRAFTLLNTLFITEIIQLLKTNKQSNFHLICNHLSCLNLMP